MNSEAVDQLLKYGSIALEIFGAISFLENIGFLAYFLPANLSIEEVKDKTKSNFESRLII